MYAVRMKGDLCPLGDDSGVVSDSEILVRKSIGKSHRRRCPLTACRLLWDPCPCPLSVATHLEQEVEDGDLRCCGNNI